MTSGNGRKATQPSASEQVTSKPSAPVKSDRIDVHTRISKDTHKRLKAASERKFGTVDIQSVVRLAIHEFLDHFENPQPKPDQNEAEGPA